MDSVDSIRRLGKTTRISPDHPLCVAARENNAYADEHGLAEAFEHIGLLEDARLEQVWYLAEQRALRVVYALHGDPNPTGVAHLNAAEKTLMTMLVAAYLDGMAIGWRGQQLQAQADLIKHDPLSTLLRRATEDIENLQH